MNRNIANLGLVIGIVLSPACGGSVKDKSEATKAGSAATGGQDSSSGGSSTSGDGSDSRGGRTSRTNTNVGKGGTVHVGGSVGYDTTTNSSGATSLGGTTSTTVLSVGGTTQGGTTSSTSTSTNVVVENGAQCFPVGARACSAENNDAQMVCSAGNVWQWSADCTTGTVCDPRPGLKVGQCFTPDKRCGTAIGQVCDSKGTGDIYSCEFPGVVTKTELCLSASCTANGPACEPWDPCNTALSVAGDGYFDCSGVCAPSYSAICRTPGETGGTNGFYSMLYTFPELSVALPPSSILPSISACPQYRVFWVWLDGFLKGEIRSFRLPKQYKAVVVSLDAALKDRVSVESSLCNLSAEYESPSSFVPHSDIGQAVVLVTEDPAAPGFRLVLRKQ